MTFHELEKICSLLWGQSWQAELARAFDIDRRTVNKWREQGVAKWVCPKLTEIVDNRIQEVAEAKRIHNFFSLVESE